MNKLSRALLIGAGSAATSVAALAATPTAANAATGSMACTYNLNKVTHTVYAHCAGTTVFGQASATLQGHYTTTGSATGSVVAKSSLGTFKGTFAGTGFKSGDVAGTWTVSTPWGASSGVFSADLDGQ
jgi:hypothetical protein